jgi:potassium-transporting ATPase KdpC subunit
MWIVLRTGMVMLVAMTAVTGLVYPAIVTGIAQVVFSKSASGSLMASGNETIGSELIGQPFNQPNYFWSRPSATAPCPYNAAASTGSNQGPTNPALVDMVAARIKALRSADPGNPTSVPVDLVTASASGLDPHISPAAAYYQVLRVARARGAEAAAVEALVERNVEGRQFGVLGEPRVNVLRLNVALDRMAPAKAMTQRKYQR